MVHLKMMIEYVQITINCKKFNQTLVNLYFGSAIMIAFNIQGGKNI